MKHIGHIDHKSITGEDIDILQKEFRVRQAVRAVIMRQDKKIAIVHSSKFNTYKLPGGGVEKEETLVNALKREILEETGLEVIIQNEIGMVTELRTDFSNFDKGLFQISYIYRANYSKGIASAEYTDSEIEEGFTWKWMELSEVLNHMKSSVTEKYNKRFELARDILILQEVSKFI